MMKVETRPPMQERDVIITLSWEEAKVFRVVCGGVSGSLTGYRRYTQELLEKLQDAGIGYDFERDFEFSGSFHDR